MNIRTSLTRLLQHLPLLAVLLTAFAAGLVPAAAIADPAARVGRIAYLEGAVDFRSSPQNAWQPAAINWPLTTGNVFATGASSRVELRVGSSVIRLGPQSELAIDALDDESMRLYLVHGSATVRIRNAEVAREFNLQMPLGQVTLREPGRLRVNVWQDAAGSPGADVHVVDGHARFDAAGTNGGGIMLAAGSRLDSRNGVVQITDLRAAPAADGFDAWSLARDRGDDDMQSLRYLSPETTGYEELDRNGVWRQTADYGPVWTPTVVVAGWAPYRTGQWIWVAPWGWTWVDSAPWGYAPSHYGRWVTIGNRWCWAPGGLVAQPVWAPALVTWRGGSRWNLADASARPPTAGWVPLAPREVYVPPYIVSRNYVQQINVTHVTNVNQINRFYDNRVAALQPSRDGRDGHDRRDGGADRYGWRDQENRDGRDRRGARDDRYGWMRPASRGEHHRRGGRDDQAPPVLTPSQPAALAAPHNDQPAPTGFARDGRALRPPERTPQSIPSGPPLAPAAVPVAAAMAPVTPAAPGRSPPGTSVPHSSASRERREHPHPDGRRDGPQH